MSVICTQGVVLRCRNRNEADRLLTVLSPDLGRIIVMARGCRKQKAGFWPSPNCFVTVSL